MSKVKGKIIDHFYGGITRDEKSRIDGVALNIEELDIFENANYVRAAQVMTRVATSSSSPSSSPSASAATASPTNSPSATPSSSPSASSTASGLLDNLVSYWKLDETSGTRYDSHANNDLTAVNSPSYATGKISNALDLEASSSQSLEIADASQVGLDNTGDTSIFCWVKTESQPSANYPIVSKIDFSTQRRLQFYYQNNGGTYTLRVALSSDGTTILNDANIYFNYTLTTGTWYHVGFVYDASAGSISVYVNNSLVATRTGFATSLHNSTAPFRIGTAGISSNNDGYFDGLIDEVGYWDRTLTTDEISALYNGGSGITYDNFGNEIPSGTPSSSPSTSASGSPYVDMTYVGSATASSSTGSAYSIDLSGLGLQQGDFVLVSAGKGADISSAPSITTSGYTTLATLNGPDTYDANLLVSYKLMGVSPDSTVDIAASGNAGYEAAAIAYVWRGVDQVTPIDATTTTATGSNSPIPNPPSITPVTTGALVVAVGAGVTTSTATVQSGFSNLVQKYASGSYFITVMNSSKFWSGSGAVDPDVFGGIGTDSSVGWAAATVALRPAGSDNSPSNSPSSSVSSSPSASVFPQDQTEITAYTGDLNDNAWGYGGQADTNAAQIFKLTNAGSDTPGSFQLVNISGDVVNEAFPQSPLQYHKTTEANAIYYLKKAGTDISLVRYDIDNDTEDVWTGSAWSAVPSSSPSPSPSASPSASAGESGDIPASSQLTGLTGTNDRYFMRVEFGELYIGNGNYIAKVDNEGTFTEKAFQLPLEWEAVDITFVADVGLILARNINRKANFSKAFWWDLTSEVQFDNQITIPHGGPQWIVNFKERLYVLCAQNGVATFYSSVASPGVPLQKVPGMELANVEAETETQEVSSPKMMAVKDGILYFGLYKTDKTGIYAIGSLDEDKPTALVLAKRFDTTDYSRHTPIALHTQGPNFFASYIDNGAFKHSRCESNNSPDRSSNAVYESVVFDEGDPTKNKDVIGMYLTTKPLPSGTSVRAYVKSDYGSWTQVLQEDGITYSSASKLLGNFRGKSISGKAHQFKFELISNGSESPIVTGLAYMVRTADLPAYG